MSSPNAPRPVAPTSQAAYGGPGWSPRPADEPPGAAWHPATVASEWDPLRAVLLHRPGLELKEIGDADALLLSAAPDVVALRDEVEALAQVYGDEGVQVHWLDPAAPVPPNQLFCRDSFAMTPAGAIVSRMASTVRAGEERWTARRLADLGVPILASVRSPGTFEGGAELLWLGPQLALLSRGIRTNAEGAWQVTALLTELGATVVEAGLPAGAMHLLGTLNLIAPDLALAWPGRLPWTAAEALGDAGVEILWAPDADELAAGMALNFVTLGPRRVLMPAGCPRTRAALQARGVSCRELAVPELIKAEGAIGCATGVLWRQA